MGGLFDGGLTKTGVQNGNSTQFYDQPAEAAVAAAHDTVAPTYRAQLPNQIQEGDTPAAKIPFAQDTASYSPKIVKPSFKEATTDPSGMPRTINPSETKMGKLLHVLSSAAQGGLAGQAASEQAVAASGGHRSGGFGTGFQAAQVAPFQRAAMQNNAQRDALQTKVAQSQLEQQNTPIQMPDGTTMAPWQWKRQQEQQAAAAELALKAAQTRQAGSVADKNEKDATVPPDQQTYNYLIKQGKTPDQALEIIKGAGQSDKAPTTPFQAYQAAFKSQNNRDMTPAEISTWEKQHAQNIHVSTGDSNAAPEPPTAADPASSSILAQTGLSLNAFRILTGQGSQLPRDKETRNKASKEAQDWANKHGVDVSTMASQYKANNDVLASNISRMANTKIMENELQGTLQNLRQVANDKELGNLKFTNVAKIWAGQEVNDDLAQQYAMHLFQLRQELSAYGAATQGRTGNNITVQDVAEAEKIIKNGIAKGSIDGLEKAVRNSTEKMGGVMQGSVDAARRAVWDLFGVGGNYKGGKPSSGAGGDAGGGWTMVNGIRVRSLGK